MELVTKRTTDRVLFSIRKRFRLKSLYRRPVVMAVMGGYGYDDADLLRWPLKSTLA